MKLRIPHLLSRIAPVCMGAAVVGLLTATPAQAGTWHIVYQATGNLDGTSVSRTSAVDDFSIGLGYWPQAGSLSFSNAGTQTITTDLYYVPQNVNDAPPSVVYLVDAPQSFTEVDIHNHIGNLLSGYTGLQWSVNDGYSDSPVSLYEPYLSQFDWGKDDAWNYSAGLHLTQASVDSTQRGTIPGSTLTYWGKAVFQVPTLSESISFTNTEATRCALDVDGEVADYPISIASPNPGGRPDLGDGTNQFIYSSDSPDGFLYIPGAYQIMNGTRVQLVNNIPWPVPVTWALNGGQIDMKVENSTVPNTFSHVWNASGATVYVNTPNNNYPGYQANTWVFKGLPSSFSQPQDGNHLVDLYVSGTNAQSAHIQTFFNGVASNWPGASGGVPDWFNYYLQAYDAFGSSPFQYGQSASSTDVSITSGSYPYEVTIKDSAYSSAYNTTSLRVFDIEPNFPKYARFIGYVTVPAGLMQFIHETAHERGHQSIDELCGDVSERDGPIYTDSTDTEDANGSTDGDIVADNWEASHHLNAGASDTTHAYAGSGVNDASDGDGEFVADVQALSVLFTNLSYWTMDWADGGIQHGAYASLPFFSTTPVGGSPVFSLTFTPASANASGAWTITGNSIQVKSVSDIQNYYNTINTTDPGPVITSLGQLGN